MNYDQNAGVSVEQVRPITKAMQALREELEELGKHVELLNEQLHPVLQDGPVQNLKDLPSEVQYDVPLANAIADYQQTLSTIKRRIVALRARSGV